MNEQFKSRSIFRQSSSILSINDVKKMLMHMNFYDSQWHKNGTGFQNEFNPLTVNNDNVVADSACRLMWQQGGSECAMNLDNAAWWLKTLNRNTFAGFSDWRFPTLEEAMSLVKPQRSSARLFIDPIFACIQTFVWTADKVRGEQWTWAVDFVHGNCLGNHYSNLYHVRAVRFQAIEETGQ